jgi:hypothetical protein
MQIETLKDLSHYYNSTDSRYIYFDKTFDIRGIDYTKFIQLKYESINSFHIKDKYTIDGWYILWYLMSRAIKNEYVSTTINSISEETKLKPIKIKEAIHKLIYSEVIIVDKSIKNLTNNELLKVYIGYNNKLCEHITLNGYSPLPNEFVYRIITTLTPTEWAIYTVILTKYNYYLAWEKINYTTGEMIPIYHRTHYAFPSRTQIGDIVGIIDDTVSKFLKKLEQNKYNLIFKYKSDPYSFWDEKEKIQKVRGGNNRYEIKLYERPEYVYYYLNQQFDKTMQKEFDYIKKKGFEEIAQSREQELIRNKKIYYIKYYYGDIFEQYDKCIKEEDYELYKYIREDKRIII